MTRPVIPVSPGPDRPVTTTAEIPTSERERIAAAIKALPNDWGFWHAAFADAQAKAARLVLEGVPDDDT